jgi:hypothetical protein
MGDYFGMTPAQIATFAGMRNKDLDFAQDLVAQQATDQYRRSLAEQSRARTQKLMDENQKVEMVWGNKKLKVPIHLLPRFLNSGAQLYRAAQSGRRTDQYIESQQAANRVRDQKLDIDRERLGLAKTKAGQETTEFERKKAEYDAKQAALAKMVADQAAGVPFDPITKATAFPSTASSAFKPESDKGGLTEGKRLTEFRQHQQTFFEADDPVQAQVSAEAMNDLAKNGKIYYVNKDGESMVFSNPKLTEASIQEVMKKRNESRAQVVYGVLRELNLIK